MSQTTPEMLQQELDTWRAFREEMEQHEQSLATLVGADRKLTHPAD